MKRLRAFWEIEDNLIVGKVLEGLLELANNTDTISEKDYKFAKQHIDRLLGKKNTFESEEKELTENEFLKQEFSNINLSLLKLDF